MSSYFTILNQLDFINTHASYYSQNAMVTEMEKRFRSVRSTTDKYVAHTDLMAAIKYYLRQWYSLTLDRLQLAGQTKLEFEQLLQKRMVELYHELLASYDLLVEEPRENEDFKQQERVNARKRDDIMDRVLDRMM